MSLVARNAIIALGITLALVATVAYAISYLNTQRITQLNEIEDQLATDMLSLDTQFSLLESAPCSATVENLGLATELSSLGERLSYAESQLGSTNPQVIRLKEQYSLLEIRDYLITKELASACGIKPVTVLYFYSNAGDCENCDKAGYALSYLHDMYPTLRVYSFDYNLDEAALQTLIRLLKIKNQPPAFVINDKVSYGFTTLEDLEKKFPRGALATTTAAQ